MKAKLLITTFLLVALNGLIYSQETFIKQWQQVYGGSESDWVNAGCKTPDGGCILVGSTESYDFNVSGNHGGNDIWVIKINAFGILEWQKCIGGTYDDFGDCIIGTSDGNYVIAGSSSTIAGTRGYLAKINISGEVIWEKILNLNYSNFLTCLKETDDNGFICGGGQNISFVRETLLCKVNNLGNIEWTKAFPDNDYSTCKDIVITTDNEYLLLNTCDVSNSEYYNNYQISLIKTNVNGEILWKHYYGGSETEIAVRCLSMNEGYAIIASTNSYDGDVTNNHGAWDGWVIFVNNDGNIIWQECYGTDDDELFSGAEVTQSGKLIVAGFNEVSGFGTNFWKLELNELGHILSESSYGGLQTDYYPIPIICSNNDIIIAGKSDSDDQSVPGNHGDFDYLIIKECFPSSMNISTPDIQFCASTLLTASSGFSEYLWNTGDTTSSINVSNTGTFSVTGINPFGCTSESELSVTKIEPFQDQQICMVTIDQATRKNLLIPYQEPDTNSDSLIIYRKGNQGDEFTKVGSIPYYQSPYFLDNSSTPDYNSYQYCVTVKDSTCGEESEFSPVHKPLFLQASIEGSQVLLNWTPYEGFDYSEFELYRATGSNSFIHIADIPPTSFVFTDMNPPSGEKRYQIRIPKDDPCGTNPAIDQVVSNIINTSTLGLPEVKQEGYYLYPNPAKEITCLRSRNNENATTHKFTILTSEGKVIQTGITDDCIDLTSIKAGNYIVILDNILITKLIKE